jgi:signal peptidase
MSRRGQARAGASLAGWVAAGLVGTLFLAVAASLLLGQRPVVVLSGSMAPAFSPGDVLIERSIEPSQVKVGQVVTFQEPGTGRMLTHRVRSIESRGAQLLFTTKGDADNSVQRWSIGRDGQLSQPLQAIPKIGYLVMFAKTPFGLVVIVLLPLLVVAGLEIARIWCPAAAEDAFAEAPGARF